MPPRASWKGFLNLSLVSVPVKAYTSTSSGGQIRLNQLHSACHSRIKQKTVCPVCGDELSRDEIVKGYEYAKDQYVVIDLEELEKLRSTDESKSIRIDTFIRPDQLDPVYFSDTSYYLVPDGAAGQKSYVLLHRTMVEEDVHCVARVVLHNREQLVAVRPVQNLLCMTVLKYASQVKSPASFDDELAEATVSDAEFELARTLIAQTLAEEFDLTSYKDQYTLRLTELIEKKVAGEEIVAAPAADTPQVISLMEALQASVSKARKAPGAEAPIKRAATRKRAPTMRKAAKVGPPATAEKKPAEELLQEQLARPKKKAATKRKKQTG